MIDVVKDKGLRLIEMYASLAKTESRILMAQAIRINETSQESPVTMLFLISSIVRYPNRDLRQKLLEIDDFDQRIEKLNQILTQEISKFQDLVKRADLTSMDTEQRREAIRSIFKKIQNKRIQNIVGPERGDAPKPKNDQQEKRMDVYNKMKNGEESEVEQLYKKLSDLKLPEETQKIVEMEMKKVRNLDPRNQEYHVSVNYLTTISNLPWNQVQVENDDPKNAREILDEDHFGLDQVKKRIVQFLAIKKLKKDNSGSIICFHGPPGVGKTSLGKSIARALKRKYYKIALGGVRDEAEIRGHRRTYVGSMPGVIIQSLIKIKTKNPIFLLDEIDKLGRDSRQGDPGAALLEVLDPSQNQQFTDHFLATPFDLSDVVFIATANQLDTIHPALLDRMEVIDLSGYTFVEKLQIAKRYLVPRQITNNGITPQTISFGDDKLNKIIMEYTAESGVRNLERAIGTVCRTVAYEYAISADQSKFQQIVVNDELIEEALGNIKYDHQLRERILKPGVAIGLAYTSIGGSALLVETTKFPGSGQLKLTGKLGEVMRESINTSISWIQTNASKIGILRPLNKMTVTEAESSIQRERKIMQETFKYIDLHVHFPAAATPKDGPSAGVTISVALVSLFTARRVRSDIAMTGEISLQGLVLPVGGIKEKCMAAHRNGIRNVILPDQNKKDINDIPDDLKKDMNFHFGSNVEQYLEIALEKKVDQEFLRDQNYGMVGGNSGSYEMQAKL